MGMFIQSITGAQVLDAITIDNTAFPGAFSRYSDALKILWRWNADRDTFDEIQGTWTQTSGTTGWFSTYLNCVTANQNDEFTAFPGFYAPETGTYTLAAIGRVSGARGISHVMLNGSDVGTMDWYAAAGAYNTVKTTSLGTITAGIQNIHLKMATKNAAASDYGLAIEEMVIYKT